MSEYYKEITTKIKKWLSSYVESCNSELRCFYMALITTWISLFPMIFIPGRLVNNPDYDPSRGVVMVEECYETREIPLTCDEWDANGEYIYQHIINPWLRLIIVFGISYAIPRLIFAGRKSGYCDNRTRVSRTESGE